VLPASSSASCLIALRGHPTPAGGHFYGVKVAEVPARLGYSNTLNSSRVMSPLHRDDWAIRRPIAMNYAERFSDPSAMLNPMQRRVEESSVVRCPGCNQAMEPKER
jgi:hypothetical protein